MWCVARVILKAHSPNRLNSADHYMFWYTPYIKIQYIHILIIYDFFLYKPIIFWLHERSIFFLKALTTCELQVEWITLFATQLWHVATDWCTEWYHSKAISLNSELFQNIEYEQNWGIFHYNLCECIPYNCVIRKNDYATYFTYKLIII